MEERKMIDLTMVLAPRFFGMLILLLVTGVVFGFALYLSRHADLAWQALTGRETGRLYRLLPGMIWIVMFPLVLRAANFHVPGLEVVWRIEEAIFSYWLFWVGLGLLPVGMWVVRRSLLNFRERQQSAPQNV
jgi:hypothetical protein